MDASADGGGGGGAEQELTQEELLHPELLDIEVLRAALERHGLAPDAAMEEKGEEGEEGEEEAAAASDAARDRMLSLFHRHLMPQPQRQRRQRRSRASAAPRSALAESDAGAQRGAEPGGAPRHRWRPQPTVKHRLGEDPVDEGRHDKRPRTAKASTQPDRKRDASEQAGLSGGKRARSDGIAPISWP